MKIARPPLSFAAAKVFGVVFSVFAEYRLLRRMCVFLKLCCVAIPVLLVARPGPICRSSKTIIAPFSPVSLHSSGDDRQSGPTGGGYYQLADDGAIVDAPQRWDQDLEAECTHDAADCSGDRVPRS